MYLGESIKIVMNTALKEFLDINGFAFVETQITEPYGDIYPGGESVDKYANETHRIFHWKDREGIILSLHHFETTSTTLQLPMDEIIKKYNAYFPIELKDK